MWFPPLVAGEGSKTSFFWWIDMKEPKNSFRIGEPSVKGKAGSANSWRYRFSEIDSLLSVSPFLLSNTILFLKVDFQQTSKHQKHKYIRRDFHFRKNLRCLLL